jgi:cyclohexa-1,5-dienecarbonyl-CoA hydratase
MTDPVTIAPQDDGAWWRVTLGGSKGNVLDAVLMGRLTQVFDDARRAAGLKAIVLEGQGAHFSFGASVQEHLPGQVAGMLDHFRHLLFALLDSSVVVLGAVRGQCLGGGLELVTLCHRIFAARDAKFGQPEITLGVFAPAASIVLAQRIGRTHAEDLCLTGRVIGAADALGMGLVDELTDDPAEMALAWARTHLADRSATSLRLAVRAIRADLFAKLKTELPQAERLYLHELMATADASEGLRAFIEKRRPAWRNV